MNHRGFTLIELILVIAILGILAVSAMPKIFSLTNEAKIAASAGVVGNVIAGITLYGAKQMASTGTESYPATLDGASPGWCTATNLCFTNVVKDGVAHYWTKNDAAIHYTDPTGQTYEYSSIDGTFLPGAI
ncbi:MAG: hypothetical protein ACD_62C00626G0005 [uncultured bacterium]|nr:MAG: hypothetical protein ACD_62C00626G0005 [uncultured bacterium]HLD45097.1 type II secretion system protein [bacterium]